MTSPRSLIRWWRCTPRIRWSVFLSARARMRHPSIAAVEAALYDARSGLRFHAMRRTLWVATPSVARMAYAAVNGQ
jgi:hypothetical protein